MAEEVRITGSGSGRVMEWEDGLPDVNDLTPLSQSLISSEFLSGFNITPEPHRNMIDVKRASDNTLSDLHFKLQQQSFTGFDSSKVLEASETADLPSAGSDFRKLNGTGSSGDGDGDGGGGTEETESEDPSARVSKRARLVWTPQLHKRFIEVVAHLGVKKAVPKTIMELMNVEGLSRENVASHLQKYRLYLKRNSDAQSSHESGGGNRFSMQYPSNQMGHHMSHPSQQMQQRNWSGNNS